MNTVLALLHMVGIAFWVGGILVYALVLVPSLTVLVPAERGKLLEAYSKRFGLLTWVAVVLVVITGSLRTDRVIGFTNLLKFSTSYGNILLVKIILAAVLAFNGAYLGLKLAPKMASFGPPSGGPKSSGPDAGGPPPGPPPGLLALQKRMSAHLWGSVGLSVVILLLTALL